LVKRFPLQKRRELGILPTETLGREKGRLSPLEAKRGGEKRDKKRGRGLL